MYGLLLAHYAVRGLLHEAAVTAPGDPCDPDTLSFVLASESCAAWHRALRPFPPRERPTVWPQFQAALLAALRESRVGSSRSRRVPRGVKRTMTRYRVRPRRKRRNRPVDYSVRIRK